MGIELKITGIEDLIAFVNIVKCKNLNAEELKKLTDDLNKSSDELIKAEENQRGE